eukprot:TRINITY_DN43524_c0_g1_i1.p1 TRINITY_DN43524_c0_g1~~TRINITY_DN43524_c0_g1_i1.p1  ORF type:complete len:743 (-),score=98.24 TRINITY_DN43524_c0_g1_i1:430-2658(-)
MTTSSSELEELVESHLHHIEQTLIEKHASLRETLKAKLLLLQTSPQDVDPARQNSERSEQVSSSIDKLKKGQRSCSPSVSSKRHDSAASALAVLPGAPSDQNGSPEELPSLLGGDRALVKSPQQSPSPSKNSSRSKQPSSRRWSSASLSSLVSAKSTLSFARFYSKKGDDGARKVKVQGGNPNPDHEVSDSDIGSDDKAFMFSMREQFRADCHRVSADKIKKGKTLATLSSCDASDGQERAKGVAAQSRCRLMHPDSKISIAFEILSMLFIIHDLIAMPLQVFQVGDGASAVERAACIYWVLNFFLVFGTGYFDQQGKLVTDIAKVVKRYSLGWLVFDVAMVVVDILLWMNEANRRSVRMFLALRLARLLRVGRLVAMTQYFRSYLALHATSGRLNIAIGIGETMLLMLCLAHLAACGWYGVSKWHETNWVASMSIEKENLWTRYIFALHWAVVQYAGDSGIQPQNAAERTYAFVVQFLAFILATIMASELTTLMTQMQFMALQDRQQFSILQRFLHESNVGTRLAGRVMDNARLTLEERKRRPDERQIELLQHISAPLLVELHYMMHEHHLAGHPFFRGYTIHNELGMRNLCHTAVRMDLVSSGDVLFSTGEVAKDPCMYFVKEGSLRYRVLSHARDLGPCSCVNEPVMWVEGWEQLGVLEACETSHVLCLMVLPAVDAMHHFRTPELFPGRYARMFVEELNSVSSTLISDVTSDFLNLKGMANSVFNSTRRRCTFDFPEG